MSININPDTTSVTVTAASNTVTVVDTANNVNVSTTQPITSVVTVAIPGPQGAAGAIPSTGSFVVTSSFNSFTGSYNTGSFSGSFTGTLTGTSSWANNATSSSFALTASYAINGINNIPQLQYNNTEKTIWNNGQGGMAGNTSFGDKALVTNSTGNANTAYGYYALFSNTQGANNTALGSDTLVFTTTGFQNVAVGSQAMQGNIGGFSNVAVGVTSLVINTSGNFNTALGMSAGRYTSGSSSRNVYLGAGAGPSSNTTENDKLYISNTAGTPLIGGDFAARTVTISGSSTFIGTQIVTGSTRGNVTTLAITSNTASMNLSTGNFFTLQLVQGTNTFINPSNILPGQTSILTLYTTGSATVSFPSSVKQPSGSAYIPTTTTGVDILTLVSFDSTTLYVANIKNMI